MKAFGLVKSDDALTVLVKGDRRKPEPGSVIVKFPGGHLELSRCSDGTYWAHLSVVDESNIVDSRVDLAYEAAVALGKIPAFPRADAVRNIGLRIANKVPHFDPDGM